MEDTQRFSAQQPPTRGTTPTSAATALAATLWYLENQSAQRDISKRFQIPQGHLSNLVKDVVNYLCTWAESVICWPNQAEIPNIEREFESLAAINCADYTGKPGHVPILAPDYCQCDYLDRNHNHSVNVMAICDAIKRFIYCFAGDPGSVHDQRVFSNCAAGQAVELCSTRHFPSSRYHIVGDLAFQLHQHVMVPYKDTGSLTVHQLNFNRQLSQTRRIIENAFGFLIGLFRRLKKLECKLDRVPTEHNCMLCASQHHHC